MENESTTISISNHLKVIIHAVDLMFQETNDINYFRIAADLGYIYDRIVAGSQKDYSRKWKVEKIRRRQCVYYVIRAKVNGKKITRYIGKQDKLNAFLKENPYLLLYGKLSQNY